MLSTRRKAVEEEHAGRRAMEEARMGREMANKIVDLIFSATGMHSIVCDFDETIVAAKVASRIGNVHSGARKMLQEYLPTRSSRQKRKRRPGASSRRASTCPSGTTVEGSGPSAFRGILEKPCW
jgi:hypothetical protein